MKCIFLLSNMPFPDQIPNPGIYARHKVLLCLFGIDMLQEFLLENILLKFSGKF